MKYFLCGKSMNDDTLSGYYLVSVDMQTKSSARYLLEPSDFMALLVSNNVIGVSYDGSKNITSDLQLDKLTVYQGEKIVRHGLYVVGPMTSCLRIHIVANSI